ncbi:MAG: hypothetical protein IKK52_01040 [Alphaproteobacteria bacterium]|nr:hypothetical protein [Alphaproteobacteria bacterium]
METKVNQAISAFLSAKDVHQQEEARQGLIAVMNEYPKKDVGYDYWRVRHLVGW